MPTTWQEIERNWTIEKAGSAHANPFPILTASAGSNANFPLDNLQDYARWKVWKSAAAGAQTLTVDCGGFANANVVAFANTNLAVGGWSTVKIQSSPDASVWTDRATIGSNYPGDTVDYFYTLTTPATTRYWRLSIGGSSAPPQIGIFCLGRLFRYREPDRGGLTYEWDYGCRESRSESGALFVEQTNPRTVRIRSRIGAWHKFTNGTDWNPAADMFAINGQRGSGTLEIHQGSLRPFFFVPRPDTDDPAGLNDGIAGRCIYSRWPNRISVSERFRNYFDTDFTIEESR